MDPQSNDIMWALVEEAVIRDRGCDEEQVLASIVRSYIHRLGMFDTLTILDEELREAGLCGPPPPQPPRDEEEAVVEHEDGTSAQQRKCAQLLCLQGRYEEAASMIPISSPLRVKLLALEALRQSDRTAGVSYAARHIAPLVPQCTDAKRAHHTYLRTVASLLGSSNPSSESRNAEDLMDIPAEVNEGLLHDPSPSALNVLVTWTDWQNSSAASPP